MDRVLQTLAAMEGLLVVQRAAELLVHQPQTLYKAIKSGRLPHVRTLGGSVRVDPRRPRLMAQRPGCPVTALRHLSILTCQIKFCVYNYFGNDLARQALLFP